MKEYVVTIGGVEHTVQLDDAEAKRIGATPVKTKAATPQNKARSTSSSKDKD